MGIRLLLTAVLLSLFSKITIILSVTNAELCQLSLLEVDRLRGFNKFYDPRSCAVFPEECDSFKCRKCFNSKSSVTPVNNQVLCPTYEPDITLTDVQETIRKKVGITRVQMQTVLDSVTYCQIERNKTIENGNGGDPLNLLLTNDVANKFDQICLSYVTPAHIADGNSYYFSPECPGPFGCNRGLSFDGIGGCRFCRIPGKICKGGCQIYWNICPNVLNGVISSSIISNKWDESNHTVGNNRTNNILSRFLNGTEVKNFIGSITGILFGGILLVVAIILFRKKSRTTQYININTTIRKVRNIETTKDYS